MTVDYVKGILDGLRQIREETKRTVSKLENGRGGLQRPKPGASPEKLREYNDRVKLYSEACAAAKAALNAYLTIRTFYAFPDEMDDLIK